MERKMDVRDTVLLGVLIAIIYIATYAVQIPGITEGGLIHMGNVAHFTIAMIFGKKKGALSGAAAMALFDLTSPYAIWAPFTFIIRFAIGYSIGAIAHMRGKNGESFIQNLVSLIPATIIMIGGYYIAEGLIYGNWVTPVVSIWGNLTQCAVGTFSVFIVPMLINVFKKRKIEIRG